MDDQELSGSEIFSSLPAEMTQEVLRSAEERTAAEGEIIVQQGDPGDFLFVIVSGGVRTSSVSEEGAETLLADIGPGGSFGESSLLTGEPQTSSVRALVPTRLVAISKDSFERLVASVPGLSTILARQLSRRLSHLTADLARQADIEKAYQRFVTQQAAPPALGLVGVTEGARQLRAASSRLAASREAVLITGAPGTEKRAAAWSIHQTGRPSGAPFLVLDAQATMVAGDDPTPVPRHPILRELAQDYALFGFRPGAMHFGPGHSLGLLQVGNGGTVVIANIEYLAESVQARLSEYLRDGYFYPFGSLEPVSSTARIIATTSSSPAALERDGRLWPDLMRRLSTSILTLSELKKRKRDLPLLVDALIAQFGSQAGKAISGIDRHALNEIMAYDWPGNTDELEVVVRRAVSLAQGDRIMLEDVFIGPSPVAGGPVLNLLQLKPVLDLIRNKAFPGVFQLIAGCFFILILVLGFWGPSTPGQNIALPLTWAVWEPLVFWGALLTARFWCGACPIGGASSLLSSRFGLGRQAPPFLRRFGLYLGAAGLGVILWLEEAASMPHSPRATAILVLCILLPALLLSLIYQRRVWCRFLCPFGAMTGYFASISTIELRGNDSICKNECTTHDCYKGADGRPGCPMFEGPFSLSSNLNCTLCGACIKACPNSAAMLNLRLPGQELWTAGKPIQALTVMVPVIAGSQIFRGLAGAGLIPVKGVAFPASWGIYGLSLAAAALMVYLFLKLAGIYVFRSLPAPAGEKAGLLSHALIPLTAGFELAYQLGRFLNGSGDLMSMASRAIGLAAQFGPAAAPWAIKAAQVVLCLAGTGAALALLKKLARTRMVNGNAALAPLWFGPVLLLAVVYAGLFLTAL